MGDAIPINEFENLMGERHPVRRDDDDTAELIIEWGAPPVYYDRSIWKRTVVKLQARPGDWALILDDTTEGYGYSTVARLLRKYGCEVATRQRQGKVKVWARWPTNE